MNAEQKEKIYRDRMNDINGWFLEAITEDSDAWKARLSGLCQDWSDCPSNRINELERAIGHMVATRTNYYCTPDEEE